MLLRGNTGYRQWYAAQAGCIFLLVGGSARNSVPIVGCIHFHEKFKIRRGDGTLFRIFSVSVVMVGLRVREAELPVL
jgi:hypothetical protein